MEKYEQMTVVGEGSYGIVMKCRHRDTDQIVAVKKFLETEEDATVRRMALREIRMLKKLKHENLVTMIEVFRHRKRFYLVFEYLEGTVLDELEKMPGGLGDDRCRERIYQVTRAINYCHSNQIIHRDVKPENVLVSSLGVVKLCDFGFARIIGTGNEPCTEYVATRWYRAPELLVGEQHYGPGVDIWAIGCLFAEMMSGDPLFPGESDIDQLFLIVKLIGKPCTKHQHLMTKNSQLRGMIKSSPNESSNLYKNFPNWSLLGLDFLVSCMKMDPQMRPLTDELLRHNYFTHDRFPQRFLPALREKVQSEFNSNPLLRRFKTEVLMSTDKKDEIKLRRSSQMDPTRWKINLTEGSVKRKFSCDTLNYSESSDRSFMSLDRSRHTLSKSFLKQPSLSKSSKQSLSTPKLSLQTEQSEIQKLEKSLESLSKFSQKSDTYQPPTQEKEMKIVSPSIFETVGEEYSPSVISFQPSSLTDLSKSTQTSQQILHPTINNISFNVPAKKSPNFNAFTNASVRSTFKQVPLYNAPRQNILKNYDRSAFQDNSSINCDALGGPPNSLNSSSWLSLKKKEYKPRSDFSFPHCPGATSSPSKTKKKMSPESFSTTITPSAKVIVKPRFKK